MASLLLFSQSIKKRTAKQRRKHFPKKPEFSLNLASRAINPLNVRIFSFRVTTLSANVLITSPRSEGAAYIVWPSDAGVCTMRTYGEKASVELRVAKELRVMNDWEALKEEK